MRQQATSYLCVFVAMAMLALTHHFSISFSWTSTTTRNARFSAIVHNRYDSSSTVKEERIHYNKRCRLSSCRPLVLLSAPTSTTQLKLVPEEVAEEEQEKGVAMDTNNNNNNSNNNGLKNAIMMGTPLVIKFIVVMIVKFVKDVAIFPILYLKKFLIKIRAYVETKRERTPSNNNNNNLDSSDETICLTAEEDLELTRKVIMGGPGTQF